MLVELCRTRGFILLLLCVHGRWRIHFSLSAISSVLTPVPVGSWNVLSLSLSKFHYPIHLVYFLLNLCSINSRSPAFPSRFMYSNIYFISYPMLLISEFSYPIIQLVHTLDHFKSFMQVYYSVKLKKT